MNEKKRILLFSGKGGVGKTSIAAATGLRLASLGHRTVVVSVDPAHSLGDSFDVGGDLFHGSTADPLNVAPNLDIQEVNIQVEIKRHWREISSYITGVLRTTGLSGVQAEELAILPGMEELSAMMYVNQYRRGSEYDVIVLDCAPTAESLRFISMPATLDWYMEHIFPLQRNLLKAFRPLANRISPIELPTDQYFVNILELFNRLDGIGEVLEDASITSARLVTNPEQMVLRETERAFVYFTLHGLTVDGIIANRVFPDSISDAFFGEWRESQSRILTQMDEFFSPVPVKRIPLFGREIVGRERLLTLAAELYGESEDPSAIRTLDRPYTFEKVDDYYQIRLRLPFAVKGEISLFKKGDNLVVQVGSVRRHIGLPASMLSLSPVRARLNDNRLTVDMKETA